MFFGMRESYGTSEVKQIVIVKQSDGRVMGSVTEGYSGERCRVPFLSVAALTQLPPIGMILDTPCLRLPAAALCFASPWGRDG